MASKVVKWKKEQEQAFTDYEHNLLVSASAGSGKTTVMIERIFRIIVDKRVPITKFLVVTFTKNSASDMKKKLIKKLSENSTDDFILEQIDDIAVSDISNLHSFCSRLISTYFYEAGVDPAYHIIDDREAFSLKNRALNKLFEQKQADGDADFFELFEIFQKKRNDFKLKEIIMQFNNILNSHLDGESWFVENLKLSHNENINTNRCACLINNYVSSRALEDAEKIDEFANRCLENGADKLYAHFVDLSAKFKTINQKNTFVVNSKNVYDINFGRTPTPPKDVEFLSEEAKLLKAELRKNIESYKSNFVSADEDILALGLVSAKNRLEKLYALTIEFNEIYNKLKQEANGLDFNDLERYALKILSNDDIKEAVRSKYEYVFVDEYQDINSVQEEIISRVSSASNRFMVGDVKQSIYRFRLCDPEIFLQKYDLYYTNKDPNRLIKLNCNFRSDKNILKFVDKIFSGVMTEKFGELDYAKDATFNAGDDNPDLPTSVNLLYIDTQQEKQEKQEISGVYSVKNHTQEETEEGERAIAEGVLVASKIAELVDKTKPEPIKLKDIAILVSSRNDATKKFVETLRAFGIDISTDDKKDLQNETHIKEIVELLKLIVNDNDDFCIFKVLKSRLFNFTDNELVDLRRISHKLRFFECVKNTEEIQDVKLRQKTEDFISKIQEYAELSKLVSVKFLVNKIIDDFEIRKINLLEEEGKSYNEDLDSYISMLPECLTSEFVLEYANEPFETENADAGDAVTLMTIHKSKGMEFKVVFVVNTANTFNFQSCYGNILFNKSLGAGMDYYNLDSRAQCSSIPISAIRITEKRKLVEEQQRVLYVALTRAINKMYVVCSKPKNEISEKFPDRPKAFINWFEPIIAKCVFGKGEDGVVFEQYKLNELLSVPEVQKEQLILTKTNNVDTWFEYAHKESVLVPQKTSVSKVLKLEAKLSEMFTEEDFEQNIISSADRGTVCHRVLELINFVSGEDYSAQISRIKTENLTQEESLLVDENAILSILKHPFFNNLTANDIVIKEREFFAYVPANEVLSDINATDDVLIQGVIDLLVIKGDEMFVVDYKTGSLTEEKLKKYTYQLDVYSKVAERIFKKKLCGKYLCLIDLKKFLEI